MTRRDAPESATSRMFGIAWVTVGRIVTRVVAEVLPKASERNEASR